MTPRTDQLVGTWTRADDGAQDAPPVLAAADGAVTDSALPTDDASVDGAPAEGTSAGQPGGAVRRRRRVTTRPVPGSDPAPTPEPARHRDGENDDQLRRDVPPHW